MCFDAGCVNLEIAGFEPVVYHELPEFPYCVLSMCPAVVHTSKRVTMPEFEHVVQRKLVVHMRKREGRPRVDWLLFRPEQVRPSPSSSSLSPTQSIRHAAPWTGQTWWH